MQKEREDAAFYLTYVLEWAEFEELLQKWLTMEADPLAQDAEGCSLLSAEELRIVGLGMPCVCMMMPPEEVERFTVMTQVHKHLCICLI